MKGNKVLMLVLVGLVIALTASISVTACDEHDTSDCGNNNYNYNCGWFNPCGGGGSSGYYNYRPTYSYSWYRPMTFVSWYRPTTYYRPTYYGGWGGYGGYGSWGGYGGYNNYYYGGYNRGWFRW